MKQNIVNVISNIKKRNFRAQNDSNRKKISFKKSFKKRFKTKKQIVIESVLMRFSI